MKKITLLLGMFIMSLLVPRMTFAWSWNSADNVLPSMREELDKEIEAYRDQVGNGMDLRERIMALDRLIGNYKPMGLNVVDLETERTRLMLQEKQHALRTVTVRDEASALYERGIAEYKSGNFATSVDTFREAERLLPDDNSIKELRRKMENVSSIIQSELGENTLSELVRLSVTRYANNDPKRATNALIYATEKGATRVDVDRLKQLIENEHPEMDLPRLPTGIGIVDHKLQRSLEAIYDGRYLTAIAECTDVLDLEPNNVLALTRLGSAYYAMNEKNRATQIWTKALQLDPENTVLKKFLYGRKGRN